MQVSWSFSATASSAQAMTLAAGWRSAISLARFGPETTATRSGPAPVTSAMTSLIRLVVPSSMPFIRLTSTVSGAQQRRPLVEVLPQGLRRDGEDDDLGAVERLGRLVGVAQTAGGSSMSGR